MAEVLVATEFADEASAVVVGGEFCDDDQELLAVAEGVLAEEEHVRELLFDGLGVLGEGFDPVVVVLLDDLEGGVGGFGADDSSGELAEVEDGLLAAGALCR